MPFSTPNLTRNQIIFASVGLILLVAVVVILGNVYGRFLKTQVNAPATQYSASGELETASLEAGQYSLVFEGRDGSGSSVTATSAFEVVAPY